MTQTILVTGATGFLGSYLVHSLLDAGYKVLAYKRKKSDLWRVADVMQQIEWFDSVDEFADPFTKNQINHVVHAAVCYGRDKENISSIIETNILFPAKLYELCSSHGVETFFNTDTFLNTNTETNGANNYNYLQPYGLSKKQFCEWLRLEKPKIRIFNLKLEHLYGPKDAKTKFIPGLISDCLNNRAEIKLTLGEQKRDFIFVNDVVKAYLCLLNSFTSFAQQYHEIQVGTGKSITIRELAELIANITKTSSKLVFGALNYRENEIMESVADISILKKLGWDSEYSLESGLVKTISYYKINNEVS